LSLRIEKGAFGTNGAKATVPAFFSPRQGPPRLVSQNAAHALGHLRNCYFLTMPVSVFPRFCTALLAAGVSTALPCVAADGTLSVRGAPKFVPVVPLFKAFAVLGPGDPPVPLIVLPFESVDPAPAAPDDPAEALPAELCARV